jgi:hypothetical protein
MKFLLNFTLFPFSHKVLKKQILSSPKSANIKKAKKVSSFDAPKKETEEKTISKRIHVLEGSKLNVKRNTYHLI